MTLRRHSPRLELGVRAVLFGLACAACIRWGYAVRAGDPAPVLFVWWASGLLLFGLGLFRPWTLPRPDGLALAVAVMLAGGLLVRLFGLATAPYAVSFDEAIHPVLGMDVLRDEPWRVLDGASPNHFATPFFDLALQSVLTTFLPPLFGARLASVVLSVVCLLATYALAARLFDRKVGAVAALVLSCSYWHIVYSRTAYPYMQATTIVPLALFVLVYALEENHSFLLYVGGLLLGASMLVYTSGRIVVPVFLLWWLLATIRGRFRWRSLFPVAVGCLLFITPYLYAQGVAGLIARYRGASVHPTGPLTVLNAGGWVSRESLEFLAGQFSAAVRIYHGPGAWLAPHDVSAVPMLDVATAVLALAGLALCVLRVRRSASVLLLVWVAGTFVGGQILTDVPHAAYRAAPLLPALAIAAGLSLTTIGRVLAAVSSTRSAPWHVAAAASLLLLIAPPNAASVKRFLEEHGRHVLAEMGRVVAVPGPSPVYYLVQLSAQRTDPRFRFIAGERTIHDVSSLEDLLSDGVATGPGEPGRDAVFVIHPDLRTAESVIRRCYPGAVPFVAPSSGQNPAIGLRIPAPLLTGGGVCPPLQGSDRGLRATYYEGSAFDGEVVRQRIEDWPVRWFDAREPEGFGSVEWSGFLRAPVAGAYALHLPVSPAELSASVGDVVLRSGESRWVQFEPRLYPVTVRAVWGPYAVSWLSWTPPGGTRQSIPPDLFSPELRDGRQMEHGATPAS